ncbi:MAG: DNA polymerase III subunit alpha [Desulfarculus sp.]|nr:DNA polymerase III subunit alpha [Pseudomonadota bacterium]MBU4599251.1 DNA polymerase III subunit alpha [Pseudomonadota bacterium]MBV1715481.1 DNA polymerase III subunit alpha [Desulfarculus sp.]MBV1739672.1 DNA polymerase III subunit alpha [Desulfarculus sp.]
MHFAQLHNHTTYSALDGMGQPDQWAAHAKSQGHQALGLSDHGTVSGALDFYKACQAQGIKPVIGCEFYVVVSPLTTKGEKASDRFHVCAYAKNQAGWSSLLKTLTLANTQFFRKPRLGLDQVLGLDNVVLTTACFGGMIQMAMQYDREIIHALAKRFGDDFYLELQPHNDPRQSAVNLEAVRLAGSYGYNLTASNDCHYITQDQEDARQVLMATKFKRLVADMSKFPGLYFKDLTQMAQEFRAYHPLLEATAIRQALLATGEIADKCALDLTPHALVMPTVDDPEATLRAVLIAGIARLFPEGMPDAYHARLIHEVGIIKQLGFIDYFLLVREVLDWCDQNGIIYGPGRGSVGGSLVAYLMGIHRVDPLKYGLFFERFLNPERISPPDIDIDFDFLRRGEIAGHLREKYGEDKVANIATFLTLQSKMALKDTARAHGIGPKEAQTASNMVINELGLDGSIAANPVLADWSQKYPLVISQAKQLEGQIRGQGKHAAGIVISSVPLETLAVLEQKDDTPTVNWSMADAEYFGLLKMDVLGLRTCTVIGQTVKAIKRRHKVDLDPWAVPLDDPETLDEFSQGNTAAIFQFESAGMQRLLKELAPIKDFMVLSDTSALFRPGPKDSGLMDLYVSRAQGQPVSYLHPSLEPALSPTFGVMVYQEQVMQVAMALCGFSGAQADTLRKGMGKKKPEVLAKLRVDFIAGAQTTSGISEELAGNLFSEIEAFASYAFNRAHSVEYALISYASMYLKIHYPLEFMAAMLSNTEDADKLPMYLKECDRLGVPLLPPDLYRSEAGMTIDGGALRVGLSVIKGVGTAALTAISEAGPSHDLFSFAAKVERRKCNKGVISAILKAGAGANTDAVTARLLTNLDDVLAGKVTNLTDLPEEIGPLYQEDLLEDARRLALGPYYKPRVRLCQMPQDGPALAKATKGLDGCGACALGQHSGNPKPVPAYAGATAKVVVVTDFPGRDEEQAKAILVGNDGYKALLIRHLKQAGLTIEDCYFTSLYKCRPANNSLPEDPPSICHQWITGELEALHPKLILAMGRGAAAFFGHKRGILASCGQVIYSKYFQAQVVLCVAPGYAMRNPAEGRELISAATNTIRSMVRG